MHTIKIENLWFSDTNYRVIYKYELQAGGTTEITGFFDEILDVQVQEDKIVVWAAMAPLRKNAKNTWVERQESEKTTIVFAAYGTGFPYDKSIIGTYFRTVQTPDGLVWHIFVQVKGKELNG